MAEPNPETALDCVGEVRPDGIYVWRVVRATRKSINQGSDLYISWRANHPPGKRFMMIFDLRPDGFPPLNYTFNRFKTLFREHPMPRGARAAYILRENSPLISVATGLYDVLRLGTNRRFYYGEQAEAKAIAFLREGLPDDDA